jgi:hypothetical protein
MLAVKPRFREIEEGDLEAVGDLLTRGFARRSRRYWMRGLHHQRTRSLPPNVPRYGYLLEHEGVPVGCLLLIHSTRTGDGENIICCNVASWYVDPPFRNYAALFASMTQRRKDITYFNVTPARPTWPILDAQGFVAYCHGLYFSLPALSRGQRDVSVDAIRQDTISVDGLPEEELTLLRRHAGYGCISLVCSTAEGTYPFIFFRMRKRGGFIPMPLLHLGYCRCIGDFIRCAGAIGRYLLLRGRPLVILDANAAVTGLAGFYTEARGRKYFKGPHRPRLGDLTDTELAIYGM